MLPRGAAEPRRKIPTKMLGALPAAASGPRSGWTDTFPVVLKRVPVDGEGDPRENGEVKPGGWLKHREVGSTQGWEEMARSGGHTATSTDRASPRLLRNESGPHPCAALLGWKE